MDQQNPAAKAIQSQIDERVARLAKLENQLNVERGVIEALKKSRDTILAAEAGFGSAGTDPGSRGRPRSIKVEERVNAIRDVLAAGGPTGPSEIVRRLRARGLNAHVYQIQDDLRRNTSLFTKSADGDWQVGGSPRTRTILPEEEPPI